MRDQYNNDIKLNKNDSKLKLQLVNTRNPAETYYIKWGDKFKNVGIFKFKVKYDKVAINTDNVRYRVQAGQQN